MIVMVLVLHAGVDTKNVSIVSSWTALPLSLYVLICCIVS